MTKEFLQQVAEQLEADGHYELSNAVLTPNEALLQQVAEQLEADGHYELSNAVLALPVQPAA